MKPKMQHPSHMEYNLIFANEHKNLVNLPDAKLMTKDAQKMTYFQPW